MRFERIRIDAFGGLSGLDTGPDRLGDLVVVHGPNEAGKTTFFHFLTALLYGFYPATRDAHPLAPWRGADPAGEATLLLGDGERLRVRRRLLSSPTGTLERGERSEELRNRTLECVEHVPLTVFRQVFAITLAELASLEGESWSRVQDRLVSGMGSTDIRPPREVAEELEREAGGLWRPSQRGNQTIRETRERIHELGVRRRNAAENDRKKREAHRELEETRARLAEAREEREASRLYVERFRALLPIRDQLERIADLREEAGAPGELEELPADPAGRLGELEEARRERALRLEDLERSVEEARERLDAYDEPARRLVEARDRIRQAVGRAAAVEPVRVRRGQVEQERRDVGRRAERLADELLTLPAAEIGSEELRGTGATEIRGLVEELRAARAEEERLDEEDPHLAGAAESASWVPAAGVALLLLGIATFVFGVVRSILIAITLGALTMVAGAAFAGGAVVARRRRAADVRRRRERAEELRTRAVGRQERAREALEEALGDIPFREGILERPAADLATRLERLRELVRDREERDREAEELHDRLEAVRGELHELGRSLGRELPEEPAAAAHVLQEALEEAVRARDLAEAATREIDRLEREAGRVEAELGKTRAEEEALRNRLGALGDGDPDVGAVRARERIAALERAEQLADELERSHHDLDEIRGRIREAEEEGEEWVADDAALARERAREEELGDRVEALGRTVERLESELEHLAREESVDEVEGEIRALRREIEDAERRRDRLVVLAAVLRHADRRFREEHQPDVLRRAGEHLESVTGGRYGRVLVGGEDGDASFFLRGPDTPEPVAVEGPLSTGTREQVYLALRLAILDHLDRNGERLPLFLDEALVNWDRERRRRALDALAATAGKRQIFFFTCHESVVDELTARGAGAIRLPRPG